MDSCIVSRMSCKSTAGCRRGLVRGCKTEGANMCCGSIQVRQHLMTKRQCGADEGREHLERKQGPKEEELLVDLGMC